MDHQKSTVKTPAVKVSSHPGQPLSIGVETIATKPPLLITTPATRKNIPDNRQPNENPQSRSSLVMGLQEYTGASNSAETARPQSLASATEGRDSAQSAGVNGRSIQERIPECEGDFATAIQLARLGRAPDRPKLAATVEDLNARPFWLYRSRFR